MPGSISINGILFAPEDIDALAQAVAQLIRTTAKDPMQYELVDSLDGVSSLPVFRLCDGQVSLVRVLTALLKGADGREVELRANSSHLQWRLDGGDWTNLISIDALVQEAVDLYGSQMDLLKAVKFDAVEKTADGLCFYADGLLVAGPIDVGSGGGSGGGGGSAGGGSVIRLQNLGSSSVGVAAGQPVVIRFNFSSLDADTDEPTGDGTAAFFVNSLRVATRIVPQGVFDFDLTPFLAAGANSVRVQVADSYGASRQINVAVSVVDIRLSSSFNADVPYSAPVVFPFTPVGSGSKTIRFVLNGAPLAPLVTTATNRQLTYALPNLTHGEQLLAVQASMIVEGVEIFSNVLVFSFVFLEAGVDDVVIASPFVLSFAQQYDNLLIPFIVFNPLATSTPVLLKVNGFTVSELTVPRTLQMWAFRADSPGNLTLEIVAGDVVRFFSLFVETSNIISEAESEGLQLFLSAGGRSNNQTNRNEWGFEDIRADLSGFNFVTNGWLLDAGGNAVLRVSAGARARIPFKIFQSDFKQTGKTVEFEFAVHDVEDFSAPVIQCWSAARGFLISPNELRFASQLSALAAKFKEDECIRVSIVVHNVFDNRLILLYLNGIASAAVQYAAADNFAQTVPVDIFIGSDLASVDVYNIRVYNAALNSTQILNNFIADMADAAMMLAVFDRNNICDAAGEIDFAALIRRLPCMTVTGSLPTFKGDKKTVRIDFDHLADPDKSFSSDNVQIDVQGTSSQFYPRKNFKTKHNNGFLMTESGETRPEYVLMNNDPEAMVFCWKTDFAESSGTHNTGLAKFINDLLIAQNIKTPPQRLNEYIRTTVDGFPVAVFHRPSDLAPRVFIGKYNFNHDKDAQKVFGLTGNAECWEFLNNTSDLCLFKSDVFSADWGNDLEARFPDGFSDNANIQILWTWVVSCFGNVQKFKDELELHFNRDNILSYCLLTELFGMVDQRAKNMFLTSWGNEGSGDFKWYFIFYDNDTSLGINNEGAIAFGYNIESQDLFGSGHVWNGWNSELWRLVELAFADEIGAMYHDFRVSGALSCDAVARVLNDEQCARWAEVVYNLDGQYKYIQPVIDDGNATYLYALQGARLEHRIWWLQNRFFYLDGKYITADFLSDFVAMRLYTPAEWTGVEPDADFRLDLFKDGYVSVKYGSYLISERAMAGQSVLVEAPSIQFNDTETVIYGVSFIKDLGSLAAKYPGTVDISQAKKLTKLIIGSHVEGYQNLNLTHVYIGNNTLLEVIDIRNCPNLSEPLDASGCDNVREIYAAGTAVSAVILPPAGVLQVLQLPASITNLTISCQPLLDDDGLLIDDDALIDTLILEHSNGVDLLALLRATRNASLNRVRLIGFDVADDDLSVFFDLARFRGVDEFGLTTPLAVVSGRVRVPSAFEGEVDDLRTLFPDLEVIADVLIPDPVTTFVFSSSQQVTIDDAVFVCNKPFSKINDFTFAVAAPAGFDILISFSTLFHETKTASYRVTSSRTQPFAVTYIPLRVIEFVRFSDESPAESVTAMINGAEYVSDDLGLIYIRSALALTGQAVLPAYGMTPVDFPASLTDSNHTATLMPFVNVRLFAIEPVLKSLVRGLDISVAGQQVVTDRNGIAVVRLAQGQYPVVYAYKGTPWGETVLWVDASDRDLRLAYPYSQREDVMPYGDLFPDDNEYDGSVIVQWSDYETASIEVSSTVADFLIDWGDGLTTTPSDTGLVTYSHSYSDRYEGNKVSHRIKIRNCDNVTRLMPGSSYVSRFFACFSIGASKIALPTMFSQMSQLRFVGDDVFKNLASVAALSLANAFSGCSQLRIIPDHIFDALDLANISAVFYQCVNIRAIPDRLFYNNPNILLAASVFSGPSGGSSFITSVPEDLFSDTSGVTSFQNIFSGLTNLSAIPANVFKNCSSAVYFSNCFSKTGLTAIPQNLFANAVAATDFSFCFSGCAKLTAIPQNLFANTLADNVSGLFSQAGSAANFLNPAQVFALIRNCPSITNLRYLLSQAYCDSIEAEHLEGIDFSNSMMTYNIFYAIKGLSHIVFPENFSRFDYITGNSMSGMNLQWVELKATTPPTITSASDLGANIPIYVPDDAVDTYKAAQGWSDYAARILPVTQRPAQQ
jgi:hypothetical protein